MENSYQIEGEKARNVYWDTEDLIGCKQAVGILFYAGVSEDTILKLNFGNLDVEAALNEI